MGVFSPPSPLPSGLFGIVASFSVCLCNGIGTLYPPEYELDYKARDADNPDRDGGPHWRDSLQYM